MVRFHLRLSDLASVSFACSPLQEAVLSLRMWTHPAEYPTQRPWFGRLRTALDGLDPAQRRLLRAVVAPNRWIPDFLTPRPDVPRPGFEHELAALRATPPERITTDLERTYLAHDGVVPVPLRGGLYEPRRLRAELADALQAYWHSCLAPHWWPQARSVLEADIAYRAHLLAAGGANALFPDIDRQLHWDHGTLTIACDRATHVADDGLALGGESLVLVPTLFAQGAITAIDPVATPLIIYPARGRGTMTPHEAHPAADSPLADLLGRPRAQLLLMLNRPATTTELADHLGITPSAVSQHLSVLHRARLLDRTRRGRMVLYSRTALGENLCGATTGDRYR
jgi:DNA-binding transcriptional ArsR family regulator